MEEITRIHKIAENKDSQKTVDRTENSRTPVSLEPEIGCSGSAPRESIDFKKFCDSEPSKKILQENVRLAS